MVSIYNNLKKIIFLLNLVDSYFNTWNIFKTSELNLSEQIFVEYQKTLIQKLYTGVFLTFMMTWKSIFYISWICN